MSLTKEPFTITAASSTDIWRKPPTTDVFNAPTNMAPTIPLTSFLSSKLTFSLPCKYRYDQAGLLLHLTKANSKDRWLKTGVEFYNGKPFVSTVGCDNFADWSIYPTGLEASKDVEVTVEVRREGDENGKGLWVYWVKDGEILPIREVAWFFAGEEDWNIGVGAMACRPSKEDVTNGEELEVKFWGFELITRNLHPNIQSKPSSNPQQQQQQQQHEPCVKNDTPPTQVADTCSRASTPATTKSKPTAKSTIVLTTATEKCAAPVLALRVDVQMAEDEDEDEEDPGAGVEEAEEDL